MATALVLDPLGNPIARLREVGGLAALLLGPLRWTPLREALPWEARVESIDGAPIATLRRGLAVLRPAVEVVGPGGATLGHLRQRLWAKGGAFEVIGPDGRRVAALRGTGLFDDAGRLLARATRDARGLVIDVDPTLDGERRALLFAAAAAAERVASGA